MQLKGNIYFHSWWHYLRDSRCQIVQCLLEASSKFGNWNWLNPLSHFCNFITPYGHYRSLWQSPGSSSAVSQNIETEVKHIEERTVSSKDILGKAAKSLRNADCSLNQSIFVNKMLGSFGCMLKPSLTRPQGGCWAEAKPDLEVLLTSLWWHTRAADSLGEEHNDRNCTGCICIQYSSYCFQGDYPRADA